MRLIRLRILGLLILGTSNVVMATDYFEIPVPGVVVTGVRSTSDVNDNVVITSSYTVNTKTSAALYTGSLAATAINDPSKWVVFDPFNGGSTITSSTFYGPNTALFNPRIDPGDVIAVGSYKSTASGARDRGMMYQGSSTNPTGGTWTALDATVLVPDDNTLRNTIVHSNMGNFVVGNYDYVPAGDPDPALTGNAFIYNISLGETDPDHAWSNIQPTVGGSVSFTAYGIWQNSSTSYTIAGGVHDVLGGIDEGYLVNYNFNSISELWEYDDYTVFNYNNAVASSLVSHFDGITISDTGFNLTGVYTELVPGGIEGSFYASVVVNPDGSFGPISWANVSIPGSTAITGNTIVGNHVLGIYTSPGGVYSYVATVPEPSSVALLGLAALGGYWIRRKNA